MRSIRLWMWCRRFFEKRRRVRAVSIHLLPSEDHAMWHFLEENATWSLRFCKEQNRNRCSASVRCWDDHGSFLQLDQAGADPFLELRENGIDFFARFDEFDLDGEMIGNLENMGGMDTVRVAKTGNALGDCGSGDSAVEEEVEDAGVDRNSVVFCTIA